MNNLTSASNTTPQSAVPADGQMLSDQRVFVPFSEDLVHSLHAQGGLSLDGSDRLVPFSLEYQCVRLLDGTYDFSPALQSADLQKESSLGQAA